MQFDKNRPHGIVYGSPEIGYEQNGRHYAHDESLIEDTARSDAIKAGIARAKAAKESQAS